jgi:UDP-N-acetylmuramoylalanine--D-glutamate ligase
MEAYIADKANIFRFQQTNDLSVFNSSNDYTRRMAQDASGRVAWFSAADMPSDLSLSVPGAHNRENAAAAYTVATNIGFSPSPILKSLATYQGLPGRLERVAVVGGVTFINDTTSTTPIAGVSALSSVSSNRIILIVGGSSKQVDMHSFAQRIAQRCCFVVPLAGDGTADLIALIMQEGFDSNAIASIQDTMAGAVQCAYSQAQPGDSILLSPGLTSFGMFVNEFDRGSQFNDEVTSIQAKSSQESSA